MNRKEICAGIKEVGIMPGSASMRPTMALFAAETVYEAGIRWLRSR
jgi:hypothetical protein